MNNTRLLCNCVDPCARDRTEQKNRTNEKNLTITTYQLVNDFDLHLGPPAPSLAGANVLRCVGFVRAYSLPCETLNSTYERQKSITKTNERAFVRTLVNER